MKRNPGLVIIAVVAVTLPLLLLPMGQAKVGDEFDRRPESNRLRPLSLTLPTLGNYANASIAVGGNTTVTPDAVPTNTTYASATTTADFKGELEAYPTTGVVRVTNAHPAGTYAVTVTANNADGPTIKTFSLTVTTPVACDVLHGL